VYRFAHKKLEFTYFAGLLCYFTCFVKQLVSNYSAAF